MIASINVNLTATSGHFDLDSMEIEKKCKKVLFGLYCLPLHLMKYYTHVRVFTNNGKVGQNAIPALTWNTATECSDREYLDDYSCPLCETKRAEFEKNSENVEARYQLETLPNAGEIKEVQRPLKRLLNPLMWKCVECPEGGELLLLF